jgi:hypothetical protein
MDRIITLCYRKIIDSSNADSWSKMVFEDSYRELSMQAQYFDQHGEYPSYAKLIQNVPDAERLSFLVAPAVSGYISQLNAVIPDIQNNLGRRFLKFSLS